MVLQDDQDKDIILLGDFNNVSPLKYNEFKPLLKDMSLIWTSENDTTHFSNYWRPDWQKPMLQGSLIDQIFISESASKAYISQSLSFGAICNSHKNKITGEFPYYYQRVSDHCPVWVSFKPFPDTD